MDDIVLAFRTSARLEEGPYFEGYCGEHISCHPGIEQKAGPFKYDGSVIDHSVPYKPDREAIRARQRTIMDLESATLMMTAEAVQRQQRQTSSAATRIKRNAAQFPCLGPLTAATPPLDAPSAVETAASAPVAGPSSSRRAKPNSRERNAIAKICSGEGVSWYETQGLLEQCGICKLYFTGSILCSHIFECSCSQ